jgi:hypothetical protein
VVWRQFLLQAETIGRQIAAANWVACFCKSLSIQAAHITQTNNTDIHAANIGMSNAKCVLKVYIRKRYLFLTAQ